MKKLFLICLMMLAGSAWAEWVMFEVNENYQFFYDPATIRKEGQIRRVWRLQNLMQPGKEGEMSRRMRLEYDCKSERHNLLSYSYHSEPLARGKELHREAGLPASWADIPPGTVGETMLKIVCAK
jgi:hypothetical protein